MPNRYAAPCYRCGQIVQPGEGVFEKIGSWQRKKWPTLPYGNKWHCQHHTCAVEWRGTAQHYIYNDTREKV